MSKTKDRIRESSLRYKHSLGQHFLYDEDLLEALVREAGVDRETDVLEIGPGCGSLTRPLCRAAGRVTAVELDERLIPLLNAFLEQEKNLTVVQGDVMTLNLAEVTAQLRKPYAVVANIPYYITTPLIQRFLAEGDSILRMAMMVQKEVADKILASPGEEGWGPLSARCLYSFVPRLAMDVPAACFTPPPKVDSAFIVLEKREQPAVRVKDEEMLMKVISAAFALRRKTMLNNLCATFRAERQEASAWLAAAGLDEKVRGEKLSLEELAHLADAMTEAGAGRTGKEAKA